LIYTSGRAGRKSSKSARVTTNDTTLGNITISFQAQAVDSTDTTIELTADPSILDFGPIEEKRRNKLETEIKNLTEEKMELSIVSLPPGFFKKVELSRSELKPGKEAKLKVELEKETESKEFRKSITVEARFGSKDKVRLTVPIVKGIGEKSTAKKGEK
jgi:hypothetical protein